MSLTTLEVPKHASETSLTLIRVPLGQSQYLHHGRNLEVGR